MRIQVLVGVLLVVGVQAGQELDFGTALDYEGNNLRRDKRTLTTICVEIKPSSPYEEPYFMCKGTDMPGYSKGGGSHGGSESESSDYSSKPSYKPSSSGQNEYHAPVKPNYYPEPTKYEKPSPSKPSYEKKPSYSSYEAPAHQHESKPSYGSHESHDEYVKPVHSSAYEKPSYHKESSYPSKPSYDSSSSYGHSEPAKPSYGGSSSYGHGESAKPSYGGSSYGHSDSSYSPPKTEYNSKPSSYPSKYTTYEHAEKPSYAPVKPSYGEEYQSKPSPKPQSDYYKPAKYSAPEKASSSKAGYSSHSQGYRMNSEEDIQPVWNLQAPQDGSFGYRSMDSQGDRFNYESPRVMDQRLDEPTRMSMSPYQVDGPTLQSTYRNPMVPPVPYTTVGSPYGPPAAPYAPTYPSYEPTVPSYPPAHPAPAPVYAPPAPSYPPPPSYAAPCPQSFLYSFQPAIFSVPCLPSPPSNYGPPAYNQPPYGHPLGAARSSDVNPQQDHSTTRTEYRSDSAKHTEDNSQSEESHEHVDKSSDKPETAQGHPSKPESSKDTKSSEVKPERKLQEQSTVGPDKGTNNKGEPKSESKDSSDTKAAYDAMVKMAKIAAQINKDKDDANQGTSKKPPSR